MRQTRQNYLGLVANLSVEQLNHIPDGFQNNLAWNYGHIVVTLPLLTYGLSGLSLPIDKAIVDRYRRGTRPEGPIELQEWRLLQELSDQTLEQVEKDYSSDLFKEYQAYNTSYGIPLSHVDDAIRFAPVHEGLHLGYAMAMIKSLGH